jgi:hypothetical protein
VQQDRYCRSCGQELQPEDRFCASCGKPVHATATVPTPEADVPVPPPPQQAEDRSLPSQAPQTRSSEEQVRSAPRGTLWAMLTVFLVVGVGQVVKGMLTAPAGKDLGDQIETGIYYAIASMLVVAVLLLLIGGVYYVTARKKGVTFREAIFNWPMVIVAIFVAFSGFLS